jgi:hypothetical protein
MVRLGALGLLLLCATHCDRDAGSGSAPSQQDQSRCKDSCNQLKFFDCNDAADHAACFEACEHAPASAIDVFVACVQADICDPECAADLEQQAGPAEGGGEDSSGGSSGTCADACSEFIAAGCFGAVDCAAVCSSLSELEQGFVVYCVDRRMGCNLPDECADALPGEGGGQSETTGGGGGGGTGPDPIEQCQSTCDDMKFFGCIDETQHADCRDLCTTASMDSIDTFVACAFGCQDDACYQVFAGG